MRDMVGHAIIPFDVGGNVDMYYFDAEPGTVMATMEFIQPDGTGPAPSRIGAYELAAFTKEKYSEKRDSKFGKMERRMCSIFTTIGNYGVDEVLNPFDTCEIPQEKGGTICLIFDDASRKGESFLIGGKKCGLLLVVEVFRSEMEFAMENGTRTLIDLLREKGYYPYSDLDRPKVR